MPAADARRRDERRRRRSRACSGIEIRVSLAWAVLLALVTVLGAQQAALGAPGLAGAGPVADRRRRRARLFFVSVIAHELAHALVGRRRGVDVDVDRARASSAGSRRSASRRPTPRDELVIALAGPLLSLALGASCCGLGVLVADRGAGPRRRSPASLVVLGALNVILAGSACCPAMPLDGGRVVRALAWARTNDRDRAGAVDRAGRPAARLVTVIGVGIAMVARRPRRPRACWSIALGWLLTTGARTLDRRLALERLLRGVSVSRGDAAPTRRSSGRTSRRHVRRPLRGPGRGPGDAGRRRRPRRRHASAAGGSQRLGRRRFGPTRAAEVMAVPPQAPFLAPDDPLWEALDAMNSGGLDGLAVAVGGHGWPGCSRRDSVSEAVRIRGGRRGGAARGGRVSGELLRVEEAQATVLAGVAPIADSERIAPEAALGRVLAAPVVAAVSLPPWDNSAMDGYAIRAADVAGADRGRAGPADGRRRVARRVARPTRGCSPETRDPHRDRGADARRAPTPSSRSRITTPLDAAGRRRAARPRGAGPAAGRVPRPRAGRGRATRSARSGSDVRGRATVIAPARRPRHAGRGRARGRGRASARIAVRRRPIVAVLATGDEVRAAGHGPRAGRDPRRERPRAPRRSSARRAPSRSSSGSPRTGSRTSRRGSGAGSPRRTSSSCRAASRSGRTTSCGSRSTPSATSNLWRVAVQPGKPFAFGRADVEGRADPVLLFGLPGNPVSAFVTFELFVRPVLRRLAGQRAPPPARRPGGPRGAGDEEPRAGAATSGSPRCATRTGCRSATSEGRVRVRLAGGQGSHVLSALAAADALAVVPEPVETGRGRHRGRAPLARPRLSRRGRTRPTRAPVASDLQEGPWIAATPRAPNAAASPTSTAAAGRAWSTSARSPPTARRAVAEAEVAVSAETLSLVIDGGGSKGDVLTVAELAGVMGGKRTAELIPLCHPLALTDLVVDDHARPRRGRAADPRRGGDDRPDRRRDGGDDRRVGGRADRLRHGQGRRARRRDPRVRLVSKTGGKSGEWHRPRGGRRRPLERGGSPASGSPAGSGKRRSA